MSVVQFPVEWTLFDAVRHEEDKLREAIFQAVKVSLEELGDDIFNLDWANTRVRVSTLSQAKVA